MTRHRTTLTVTGLVILGAALFAQTRPNFSGRWVQVSPAEGAGQEQVVKHDATTLSSAHPSEGGEHGAAFKLDGSESRNVITSHGEDIVTTSRAEWKGDKVVIASTTVMPDGRKMEDTRTWSLDGQGRLVIEFTRSVAGQPPMTMTLVHTKR